MRWVISVLVILAHAVRNVKTHFSGLFTIHKNTERSFNRIQTQMHFFSCERNLDKANRLYGDTTTPVSSTQLLFDCLLFLFFIFNIIDLSVVC